MGSIAHEHSRKSGNGLVIARRAGGVVLASGVALALVAGIAGGLLRAGVAAGEGPAIPASAAAFHAALMIGAFFGTLIGVERAVAARHVAAWGAPVASAGAGIALVTGAHAAAAMLLVIAGCAFVAVNVALLHRQWAAHTALLVVAAASWLVGNALFLLSFAPDAVVPWWFLFLVGTVAAERLEMTRLARRGKAVQRLLFAIVGAMALAAAVCAVAPGAGFIAWGAGLVALATWLLAFDIVRHTIRTPGLPRYMGVCLGLGYAWLAVGGLASCAVGLGAPARDIALHAVGLGFVFSMVMAHAPVILPAVTGMRLRYSAVFYVPVVLLHASLALRVSGSLQAGAAFNAASIALFALTVGGSVLAQRYGAAASTCRTGWRS